MSNVLIQQESTFIPNVDYEPHAILESGAAKYLQDLGFYIHESTYHSIMPQILKDILTRRFSFTSLYIRGRADRLAIHSNLPIEFEWEAKTHNNIKYNDLTLEALPLIHHISKSKLGVECLYIARVHNHEFGFWIDKMPPIRNIFLPPRSIYDPIRDKLKIIFKDYFPNKEIYEWRTGGTNDPFIIIDSEEINKLPDWRELVISRIDNP